jgi:hypothetical protein
VGPPALSTSGFRLCHVCELGRGDMSEIRSTKHTDRLRGIHDTDYGANGIQLPPTALRSRLVGPAGYCDGKGGSGMRGDRSCVGSQVLDPCGGDQVKVGCIAVIPGHRGSAIQVLQRVCYPLTQRHAG